MILPIETIVRDILVADDRKLETELRTLLTRTRGGGPLGASPSGRPTRLSVRKNTIKLTFRGGTPDRALAAAQKATLAFLAKDRHFMCFPAL
jgi:hypothetical protein